MTRPTWSSETTAARLLDMKLPEFCSLVEAGHLPKGETIAPGLVRWKTEALEKIASGAAINEGMVW